MQLLYVLSSEKQDGHHYTTYGATYIVLVVVNSYTTEKEKVSSKLFSPPYKYDCQFVGLQKY